MVDWQITAATFRCAAVNDEVTLLVHKDWTVKCTGYVKHGQNKKKKNGTSGCHGENCQLAVDYRKKLQAEETAGIQK